MLALTDKIRELPPELQQEVEDFVDFLLVKWTPEEHSQPTFSWAGALKDLGEQYTSIELQHEISNLRLPSP